MRASCVEEGQKVGGRREGGSWKWRDEVEVDEADLAFLAGFGSLW